MIPGIRYKEIFVTILFVIKNDYSLPQLSINQTCSNRSIEKTTIGLVNKKSGRIVDGVDIWVRKRI
ncbi:hypothetical protein QEH57_21940 [Pelagicoccus sp. SDUM812005]|nr:hypothetical protein [Pelagicoccus sp. SDUM812005]